MAKFPQQVELNEDELNALTELYKRAYVSIIKDIESASSFSGAYRRSILREIEHALKDLGQDSDKWLKEKLPYYYKQGAEDALSQLKHLGADIKVGYTFGVMHRDAIEALVSETSSAFATSINTVGRNTKRLIDEAKKQEIRYRIAEGKITGETRKQITGAIKETLKEEGIDALTDSRGAGWTLDRYSDMLVRTKTVEARNTGLVNKMLENDYDLVQVSSHGADDVCGDWEGKILSITGQTEGYDTLDEAEADGLFHPNCKHAINVINPELAQRTNAYGTVREEDIPAADYVYIRKGGRVIKYPIQK